MSDKDRGALLFEPPTLEVEGKTYELRRLGVVDLNRLLGIVSKASKFVDRQIMANADGLTATEAGTFLIDYLPHAFDEIVAFLANLIGLDPGYPEGKGKNKGADKNVGTMRDPDVFPISALPVLIEKVAGHPDVVGFFDGSKAMVSSLKRLFGGSDEPSTESSDDTDGPTNTSLEDD